MDAAQMYQWISIAAFILAAIGLILAIVFWFLFRIPVIYSDLSGRSAKRSIRQMRSENEQKNGKAGMETGKQFGMHPTGAQPAWVKTEELDPLSPAGEESTAAETAMLFKEIILPDAGTTRLDDGTALLDDGTALLDDGTALLDGGTELLGGGRQTVNDFEWIQNNDFEWIQNIVIIHTDEVII